MENKIKIALDLINREFENKFDKGGKPYIDHLHRVSNNCITNEQKIVGLLHDLLEDTNYSIDKLKTLFSDEIVESVILLTKSKNGDYQEYLNKIYKNELAKYVKLRDLEDNLNILRLKEFKQEDFIRLEKYFKAHKFLSN
jgi:(p)ppGpp synthase/HD superfamily hydrolase